MEEQEDRGADLERSCQGVSSGLEACTFPATIHCTPCGRWFCDAHAEDKEWHPCMQSLGDGGGEA